MARMPAVGPRPTMPTKTSPNTSVWIERTPSRMPLASQARGRGAARLRAVSTARGSESNAPSKEPRVAMRRVVQVASPRPAR